MSDVLENKVASSGLITLDLVNFLPEENNIVVFDLKDYLFMGLILKEKDFRESLKNLDLEKYRKKNVTITCSADAIIPVWAFMLVTAILEPVAASIFTGTSEEVHKILFLENIGRINVKEYEGQRIVIKGCGEIPIGNFAYSEITRILRPVVKSIMYGEPCSTVPVYKKK